MQQVKILLDESDIPTHWYNVVADMPNPPAPPLGPDGKPIGPEALAAIFPARSSSRKSRASAGFRFPSRCARSIANGGRRRCSGRSAWKHALGTPARIYYKYEGVSPAGSHKPNTAVAQAYFNHMAGVRRLATETGAGQWGSALAMAGQMFGIEVRVYMVRVSYRSEAVPPLDDGNLGRRGDRQPQHETPIGPRHARPRPGVTGLAGHRDFRGGGGGGCARRYQLRAGVGAQPRAAASDRHRAGSEEAVREGRRLSRRGHRMLRRRIEFRRHRVSVSSPTRPAGARCAWSRWSRSPAPP